MKRARDAARMAARTGRFAGQALVAFRLRTAMAVLAVALGVACLTILAAARQGALCKASEIFQWYGADAVFVIGTNVTSRSPRKPMRTLTVGDVRAMATGLPEVAAVSPVRTRSQALLHSSSRVSSGHLVVGATQAYSRLWNWPLAQGRDLDPRDVAGAAKVAILGANAARRHFGNGPAVGRGLRLDGMPVSVIGVLQERDLDDGHGNLVDDRVVVPLTTLTRRFNMDRTTFMSMRVAFKDGVALEHGMAALRQLLRHRHGMGPGRADDFSVIGPKQILAFRNTLEQNMMIFLGLAAGLALTAGGAVLANAFHINLAQRRTEIGLRRALGATARLVMAQILTEAVLTVLLGAGLGLGLGAAASLALERAGLGPAGFAWPVFALGVAGALAVGLGAGLGPALEAARIEPARILRGS